MKRSSIFVMAGWLVVLLGFMAVGIKETLRMADAGTTSPVWHSCVHPSDGKHTPCDYKEVDDNGSITSGSNQNITVTHADPIIINQDISYLPLNNGLYEKVVTYTATENNGNLLIQGKGNTPTEAVEAMMKEAKIK